MAVDEPKRKRTYEVTFQNKTCLFHDTAKEVECYLGVPLDITPGIHSLMISERKGRKIKKRKYVEILVRKTDFPVENIKFTQKKKKKIGAPENIREIKLIGQAKRTETLRKLWDGKFLRPVKGRISGVFGAMRKSGNKVLRQHTGVDFSARKGRPVLAPACGRVILAHDDFNLHGKTVMLDHGIGVVSIYIHLNNIKVSEGEPVKRGQIIGSVGSTGLTTGPHLHWGVFVHSEAVNPLWWLEGNED